MDGGAPLTKAQAQELLALGVERDNGRVDVPAHKIEASGLFKNINWTRTGAWCGWNQVIHYFKKEALEKDIAADIAPETAYENQYQTFSSGQIKALERLEAPYSKGQSEMIVDLRDAKNDPVLGKIKDMENYIGHKKTVHYAYYIFDREVLKASQKNHHAHESNVKTEKEQTRILLPDDVQKILDLSVAGKEAGQRVVSADDLKTVLNTATIKKLDQYEGFVARRTNEDRQRIYIFDEAVLKKATGHEVEGTSSKGFVAEGKIVNTPNDISKSI